MEHPAFPRLGRERLFVLRHKGPSWRRMIVAKMGTNFACRLEMGPPGLANPAATNVGRILPSGPEGGLRRQVLAEELLGLGDFSIPLLQLVWG